MYIELMNIYLENSNQFKNIIQSLKDFQLTEVNFQFNGNGVKLQAMDSSHISLIDLFLHSDYFTQYNIDKSITLGIDLGIFNKLLKGCGEKNELSLSYILDTDEFTISIKNGSIQQDLYIPLMNFNDNNFQIKEQYSYNFVLDNNEYKKAIHMLSLIEPDECFIEVKKTNLIFSGKGEIGKTQLNLPIKEIISKKTDINGICTKKDGKCIKKEKKKNKKEYDKNIIKQDIDKDINKDINKDIDKGIDKDIDKEQGFIKILFCFNHLKYFSKSCALIGKNFTLSIDIDYPMKLETQLDKNSYLKYYIAPKIE